MWRRCLYCSCWLHLTRNMSWTRECGCSRCGLEASGSDSSSEYRNGSGDRAPRQSVESLRLKKAACRLAWLRITSLELWPPLPLPPSHSLAKQLFLAFSGVACCCCCGSLHSLAFFLPPLLAWLLELRRLAWLPFAASCSVLVFVSSSVELDAGGLLARAR